MHKTLLRYTQFPCLQISIPATIILGMLNLHVDESVADITKEVISSFLLKIVTAAKESTTAIKLDYVAVSLLELLKGANGLALSNKNAEIFVESDILSSLLRFLRENDSDDKLGVLDLLWTLATHSVTRELLRVNSELIEEVKSLSDVIPAAKCASQKIEGWNQLEGKPVS